MLRVSRFVISLVLVLAALWGVLALAPSTFPAMAGPLAPQTLIIESSHALAAPAFSRQSPLSVTWRTLVIGWDQTVISTSLWYRQNQGPWTAAVIPAATEFSGTFAFVPGTDGRYAFTTVAYTDTGSPPILTFAGDVTTTYDTLAPTVLLTAPHQIAAAMIPLQWSLRDSLSGILNYTVAYSSAGAGWQPWPTPVTATSVVTQYAAASGACYAFRVQGFDRAGNSATAQSLTCVAPARVYLPLTLRNRLSISLRNGGFESGEWSPWTTAADAMPAGLLYDAAQAHAGQWSALLGDPAAIGQGDVPVGSARLWQTFSVPQMAGTPVITIHYHLVSQDIVRSSKNQDYLDSFEIYLNTFPSDANTPVKDDPQRMDRCVNALGQPATAPTDGLVFCDGRATAAAPNDLGWRTVTLNLSAYKGLPVTLYLAAFNRWDGWYNTYVYVDDVQTGWR